MLKYINMGCLTPKGYELLETRLVYKNFNELKKYISVQIIMYSSIYKVKNISNDIILLPLPFKTNTAIKKIMASIFIHYKFLNMIKKEKNNLFIISVTSKLSNILLIPFTLYNDRILIQLNTPSVAKNKWKRRVMDAFTRYVLILFKNYLITGDNRTKKVYRLLDNKCIYVKYGMPIYGEKYSLQKDKIRLLYLGTLNGRKLDQVILGIKKFINEYDISIAFNICGFGDENEIQQLQKTIEKTKLQEVVKYHGFVTYREFKKFIDISNIGVSYVPNIPEYNGVSITKTIEYMLAGLPVIGTKNSFNRDVINETNGLLCNDNPDSFCTILSEMWHNINIDIYKPSAIKETVKEFSMSSCIKEEYLPIIKRIAKQQNCNL